MRLLLIFLIIQSSLSLFGKDVILLSPVKSCENVLLKNQIKTNSSIHSKDRLLRELDRIASIMPPKLGKLAYDLGEKANYDDAFRKVSEARLKQIEELELLLKKIDSKSSISLILEIYISELKDNFNVFQEIRKSDIAAPKMSFLDLLKVKDSDENYYLLVERLRSFTIGSMGMIGELRAALDVEFVDGLELRVKNILEKEEIQLLKENDIYQSVSALEIDVTSESKLLWTEVKFLTEYFKEKSQWKSKIRKKMRSLVTASELIYKHTGKKYRIQLYTTGPGKLSNEFTAELLEMGVEVSANNFISRQN